MCASSKSRKPGQRGRKSGQDKWIAAGLTPAAIRNRRRTLNNIKSVEDVKKRWPRLSKVAGARTFLGYIREPSFGNILSVESAVHRRHPKPNKYFSNPAPEKKVRSMKKGWQKKSGQDTSILGRHGEFRKGWM